MFLQIPTMQENDGADLPFFYFLFLFFLSLVLSLFFSCPSFFFACTYSFAYSHFISLLYTFMFCSFAYSVGYKVNEGTII
jgi:hypothetical protein